MNQWIDALLDFAKSNEHFFSESFLIWQKQYGRTNKNEIVEDLHKKITNSDASNIKEELQLLLNFIETKHQKTNPLRRNATKG